MISIPIFLVLLFVVTPIAYQQNLKANDPEAYAKLEEKWAEDRATAEQERIEAEIQAVLDRQAAAEEREREELEKQEALRIEKLSELPESCYGVNSVETWLYPTGQQCIDEINQRFYDWCLSEERKLTETGAAARADLCVIDIQRRLVQTCADPVLSSPEVCLMNSMQHLYSNLIPE